MKQLKHEAKSQFFVSDSIHPQSIDCIKTRAEYFGMELVAWQPIAFYDRAPRSSETTPPRTSPPWISSAAPWCSIPTPAAATSTSKASRTPCTSAFAALKWPRTLEERRLPHRGGRPLEPGAGEATERLRRRRGGGLHAALRRAHVVRRPLGRLPGHLQEAGAEQGHAA